MRGRAVGDDARREGDLRRGGRRHAPDAETRDRILDNRIYQQISDALAGSQEYMAMEKLFELHAEDRYDLLVLDTPPTPQRARLPRRAAPPDPVHRGPLAAGVHAADRDRDEGLRPRRLGGALGPEADHRRRPARRPAGVLPGVQRHGRRLPGARQAGQRAARRPQTCFLVVCGPQGEPIDEAVYFHRKLVEAKLPFGGVIVNRVHYPATAARRRRGPAGDAGEQLGDADLAERVAANFADYQALAERDAAQHRAPRRARCGPARDPGPLPGRGRPRPRRAGGDQPLPVRRGRGAGGSRRPG